GRAPVAATRPTGGRAGSSRNRLAGGSRRTGAVNGMSKTTFYWHDYETFGANPRQDRPAQFAGLRTDADLNVIGEPLMLYCQPPEDTVPHPEATLITGITPQTALER